MSKPASSPPPDTPPTPDSTLQVRCPRCGGTSLYSPANRFRPFCSERCKQLDLGAWASERFRVEGEAPPDDQPFGDPRLQ